MLSRLGLVRKFGLRTAKTTTIATRPNSVPASRSPTLRLNRRRLGAAVAAMLLVLDMAQDLETDDDVGGGDDGGTASTTIASSLRPPRSRTPAIRPSRITRTRSATRRISGSSEETTIIERPSLASRSIRA